LGVTRGKRNPAIPSLRCGETGLMFKPIGESHDI
jgi:hypothetical protein